ncbi:XRE family transcriptional regulator [Actinoplanes sp. NPDC051346]|uniref:XRE family transcriptional regulator n=1 Tax=Actinoplanes sp. NPDC051346 TaxID=3155048 RepID=UPI0034252178
MSHKAFARAVREASARHGQPLKCGHTSVSRWLSGMRPRGLVPMYIAEALSVRLSRSVTLAEIGFPSAEVLPDDFGTTYEDSVDVTTETLAQLWRADVADDPQILRAPAHGTAGIAAALSWLVRGQSASPRATTAGRRVGLPDIEAFRATVSAFSNLDNAYGGGQARKALVQFLGAEGTALLRGAYSEPVGRQLHAAVSEATLLAAWTAYDAGVHGVAQRYFIQALRLAQGAGDALLAGSVLDAMSHQATFLRRHREAVDLARAARTGTQGKATATLNAHFYAMEARALACGGDAKGSLSALSEASRLFEQRRPEDDPAWIGYFDVAELNAEFSHCLRDLGRHREAAMYASESLTAAGTSTRSDFFVSMVLAAGHAGQGDPESAFRAAGEALTAGLSLKSARCLDYLRNFRSLIVPFENCTAAKEFIESFAENEMWVSSAQG